MKFHVTSHFTEKEPSMEQLEIMKCPNCKEGKPCPIDGGRHLHLTHSVSVDPVLCECGAKGRVGKDGGVSFVRDAAGRWVDP